MLSISPVIWEVKLPKPVPSVVLLSFIVGFGEVLQHTPRDVISNRTSDVIFPPHTALSPDILVTL